MKSLLPVCFSYGTFHKSIHVSYVGIGFFHIRVVDVENKILSVLLDYTV